VPQLTETHFISKLPPSEKKTVPRRWCVVPHKCRKKKEICTDVMCDAGLFMNVLETATPSSISKIIKY
jgi:hypothetical protein